MKQAPRASRSFYHKGHRMVEGWIVLNKILLKYICFLSIPNSTENDNGALSDCQYKNS